MDKKGKEGFSDSFFTEKQREKLEESISKYIKSQNIGNNINHPKHYNSNKSGIECIEIASNFNFCLGNAIKYIWRAGLKVDEDSYNTPDKVMDAKIEDLQKAIWYLSYEIKQTNDMKNAYKEQE